jgi:ATP-dependent Lhr-like helicase
MDVDGLIDVLRGIEAGEVTVHGLDTPEPSLLSHQLLNAAPYAFLDDTPLEERRARAVSLRRGLPAEIAQAHGAGSGLDPQAIAQVRREAWPVVRDDDELHDALLTLHYMPADLLPQPWEEIGALPRLIARRRVTVLSAGAGFRAYVPSERAALVRCLFGDEGQFDPAPPEMPWPEAGEEGAQELAALAVVRGWMMSTGPWSDAGLARALGLPQPLVEVALLRLEAQGQVLRGRFTPAAQATEFCDRRLLSRIHRLTTARLRREIEPVSLALFMRFLTRWQHALPATRLSGQAGLRHVLAQLQGFEACAAAWEEEILPARLSGYDPAWLDALCLSGELAWGRLRPTAGESRRGPTRAAPISLWLRESQGWLVPPLPPSAPAAADEAEALSPLSAKVLALLSRRGALFLPEICAATASREEDVLAALGELVSHGRATADSFAGLRRLLGGGERARSGPGPGPGQKTAGTGRWSLLYRGEDEEAGARGGDEVLSAWARQYLRRWGVLCRDLCLREGAGPSFGEILPLLRVMEARGQVRGGRFIAGLSGEQFALPEAVEGLRALRRHLQSSAAAAPEEIDVAAADPLNLIGTVLPGQRVAVSSAARVRLRDGVPQAQAEAQESGRSEPEPAQRTSCTADAHP